MSADKYAGAAFHASRLAQQAAAPLRKLTALEILGRSPVAIEVPEFGEGAVVYFSHPSAKQVTTFLMERSNILRQMRDSLEGMASGGDGNGKSSDSMDLTGDQIETMRMASCRILASMLVNEDGTQMLTLEQISEEMSRENFMVLTSKMIDFLGLGVTKSVADTKDESEKSDEEIESDLIMIEEDLLDDVDVDGGSDNSDKSGTDESLKNH